MEYFKETALGMLPLKPTMWPRYVDDNLIPWPHQINQVNSIRPLIQFKIEKKKKKNQVAFLDGLITYVETEFKISLYCKPIFTRQYQNFNFHHLYCVKKEITCCLQHRAKVISPDTYQQEMVISIIPFIITTNSQA